MAEHYDMLCLKRRTKLWNSGSHGVIFALSKLHAAGVDCGEPWVSLLC